MLSLSADGNGPKQVAFFQQIGFQEQLRIEESEEHSYDTRESISTTSPLD
jgi:hypothetical protein